MRKEIKFEYGFQNGEDVIKKIYNLHEIPYIRECCIEWDLLPIKYVREYTGVFDVYEGDIMKRIDTGDVFMSVWQTDCYVARDIYDAWTKSNNLHKKRDSFLKSSMLFKIAKIGDKYNNPELLNYGKTL